MPITKSAKKALRQTARRTARNLQRKTAYRKVVKQIKHLLAEKNVAGAESLLPQAYKAFDKAAKTGVLKPNNAARKKSRLTKLIRASKTAS